MLKIWGRTNSINVQKVLWCCAELEVAYDRIDAGMQFGVNNTPEYRAMNPNALVPTINDDGFVLWESHAIVRYLARRHGAGTLCPSDPQACADSDRWMDWHATTVWPNLRPVFWNLVRIAPDKRDMALVNDSRDKLAASYALLDAHLANRRFVTGEAFTMGDIPLGTGVQRWFNLPIKREPMPNLEAYYRRLQQRPAFKQFADLLPLN
jgi:glutathione S-transferase